MAYTMDDFMRDTLTKLSPTDRKIVIESTPVEERLAGVPVEQLLACLSEEDLRRHLKKLKGDSSSGSE